VNDISESIALARARQRGDDEDRFEKKGSEYHARVRAAFLQIAATDPARYRVINADQDIDSVNADIVSTVNEHFTLQLKASGEA